MVTLREIKYSIVLTWANCFPIVSKTELNLYSRKKEIKLNLYAVFYYILGTKTEFLKIWYNYKFAITRKKLAFAVICNWTKY